MSEVKAISVTRLVRRMRNILEIELGELWVEGEISNLRKQASGHQYFTLKDDGGQIPCVMFRGNASKLSFDLENGQKVLIFAEASLYEARGQVQLIVRKVEQRGQGDLQQRFEQLKAKLAAEGLFDQERKQEIPSIPRSIGFVTSPSAAALQDMLKVLQRRAPWIQPILYPVQVQGNGAEHGIAEAIRHWSQGNGLPQVDVLIVGRGGGSIEDLWNFNEEVVARAIAECKIPVISAVGHEIDFTIADFVADKRAATPSAAVELAVPDGEDLKLRIKGYSSLLEKTVLRKLENSSLLLDRCRQSLLAKSPDAYLRESALRLDSLAQTLEHRVAVQLDAREARLKMLSQRHGQRKPAQAIEQMLENLRRYSTDLDRVMEARLEMNQIKLERLAQMHRALGPDTAFSRGFSVTTNRAGEVVKSKQSLASGEQISTRFIDGSVESTVD